MEFLAVSRNFSQFFSMKHNSKMFSSGRPLSSAERAYKFVFYSKDGSSDGLDEPLEADIAES